MRPSLIDTILSELMPYYYKKIDLFLTLYLELGYYRIVILKELKFSTNSPETFRNYSNQQAPHASNGKVS